MGIIPRLDACCCGCQLRTGSKIVAWYSVIIGALGILINVLSMLDLLPEEPVHYSAYVYIIATILHLVRILFSFILLIGAYKAKVSYYLPWIVYIIVFLALECQGLMTLVKQGIEVAVIVVPIIKMCIDCYCILVIYSDYRRQKEHSQGIEGIC